MTEQLGVPPVQALHDAYGGWLDEQSVTDFAEYAEVVFKALGHRVTNWSTFNEPWTFVEVRQGRRRCWCWVLRQQLASWGCPITCWAGHLSIKQKISAISFRTWQVRIRSLRFAIIQCAHRLGQQLMQEAGTSDL